MNVHKRNMRLLIDYSDGMPTKDLEEKYGITRARIYQIFSDLSKEDMETYQEEHFLNKLKNSTGTDMTKEKLKKYLTDSRNVSLERVGVELGVNGRTIEKLREHFDIVSEITMTRETIKETIKYLYHSSFPLSYLNVGAAHRTLLAAAVREYGTWDEALKDAGLCFKPAKDRVLRKNGTRRTKKELIDEITTMFKAGTDMSAGNIQKSNQRILCQARRIFLKESLRTKKSTWEIAITRAGLDYSKVRRHKYNVTKCRKTRKKRTKVR